ncbi:unnamed protein product [Nezara viridula]|uniref:Uncharacterized protein n=1 Tax=Nezara viridula TaxID=85310 RepID=A0A9P0HU12_NEZVI|nr:unnamed protein product [Nezara viridula]
MSQSFIANDLQKLTESEDDVPQEDGFRIADLEKNLQSIATPRAYSISIFSSFNSASIIQRRESLLVSSEHSSAYSSVDAWVIAMTRWIR